MRFHVLGVCHTVSSKEYVACAFTQKVVKFCEMMMKYTPEEEKAKAKLSVDEIIKHKTLHHVIHYGHERSKVIVDEHVTVMTDDVLIKTYGEYNWKKEFFKHQAYDLTHNTFTINAIREVAKRKRAGDIILCFWGLGGRHVAEAFSDCLDVEPGIGYPVDSCFARFKVYESYAIMHNHYGMSKNIHPGWYDCVIPNYFDPQDFEFKAEKGNYFLYLGRITKIKGLDVILHLAKAMGFRLIVAGQGSMEHDLGYKDLPSNIQYVGYADVNKRKNLMANAKALFLPTAYIEPFGGVTMEAMMSGTPVITTDWGVFSETVLHGITGYRCRTLDQFEWAIRNIDKINPQACRDWAVNNYGMDRIRGMYEEYFDMLIKLKFGKGFHQENYERTELDWLVKQYPPPSLISNNKLPRICIFTETKWAFGRIFQAVQKYSKKFNIDLFDWSAGFPKDLSFYDMYDLIYTTVWDTGLMLEQKHPSLKDKITFSGHGIVDFLKMNFKLQNINLNEQTTSLFDLDKDLVNWLQNRKLGFSVVSSELYQKLSSYPGIAPKLSLTQCGVDQEIFSPLQSDLAVHPHPNSDQKSSTDKLKVLYMLPLKSMGIPSPHGYNVKRQWLVEKIKHRLQIEEPNIEIIYPNDFLPLDKMQAFYQQADVWLCVSHSEGNPLGAFEAGACGLTVISTNVGAMPNLINDGVNGYLIENGHIDQIEKDIVDRLKTLNNDRSLLNNMKNNMITTIKEGWTWEKQIAPWEAFFERCLSDFGQPISELQPINKV